MTLTPEEKRAAGRKTGRDACRARAAKFRFVKRLPPERLPDTSNDGALIEAFLAERKPTVCPTMYAEGSVVTIHASKRRAA